MGYYGTGLPELFGKAGAWPKGRGQPLGCGMDHSSSFCMRVRIPAKSDDLDAPRAEIRNDQIRAAMYLPDRAKGFYHATRFDWSGVVFSLRHKHHEYYGPWFNDTSPSVHDFVYDGPNSITAGPCSAAVGRVRRNWLQRSRARRNLHQDWDRRPAQAGQLFAGRHAPL